MISSQVWQKQGQLKVKLKMKKQVKLKLPKNKGRPKSSTQLLKDNKLLKFASSNPDDLNTFLVQQAKKIKAEQVVLNRKIKSQFNLTYSERSKLLGKIKKAKTQFLRFITAIEGLRRLIDTPRS